VNETQGVEALQLQPGRVGQGLVAPTLQPIISINQVENGFIVVVSCKQFVSQHLDEMLDGLRLYFTKPDEAAKKFLKERK